MIDRHDQVSVTRQAQLLSISRGSVYYLPRPVSEADLALMRRIDQLHLEHPFLGSRMLRDQLRREGVSTVSVGSAPHCQREVRRPACVHDARQRTHPRLAGPSR